jgi:molecular chaperone GrpE
MTESTARAPETASAEEPNTGAKKTAEAKSAETKTDAADVVAALTREVAEQKDKHLRALAEMENLRRRTERETVDSRLYAVTSFARDVLGIADNMRRALETVGPSVRDAADGGVKALVEGVELTERELLKVLDKHGVKKFEPLGEKFDPNLHQAMYEIPDPSVPAGTVVQVMQAGFKIGERVLRPAMVAVSKVGPKAVDPVDSASGNGSQ